MHPDDPWENAVVCSRCHQAYLDQRTFERHYCWYTSTPPEPARPLAEVISEAQIEEARDDLVDLLRELS